MIPKDRRDQSRKELEKAFYFALGMYTEQESKKNDQWQDISISDNFQHLQHEMQEIRNNLSKNMDMTYLVHNCADAVGLSCILLAQVMKESGMLDGNTKQ